ncbi:hypothetical protein ASG43_00045 [Aureimonas sp. Leaf454]|nr:hypothetical protein ASG43_00045 [Aureimonas sp. Leaf454]
MPFSADGTDLDAATQALQDLGFGGHEPMLPAGTERAGILASFILNAAMIPGWPPPRPIEGVEIKTLQTLLSKNQIVSKGDLELLLYLANIGFSRAHLSKFLKRVEDRKRRSRILRAVALIMTNLVAVVDVMGRELQMLREEASDETRPKGPSHRARIGV